MSEVVRLHPGNFWVSSGDRPSIMNVDTMVGWMLRLWGEDICCAFEEHCRPLLEGASGFSTEDADDIDWFIAQHGISAEAVAEIFNEVQVKLLRESYERKTQGDDGRVARPADPDAVQNYSRWGDNADAHEGGPAC